MLKKFINDESGAVTIDWVVLTAGILLLGIAVVYGIFNSGVTNLATAINTNLNSAVSVDTGNAPTANQFTGISSSTDGVDADGNAITTTTTSFGTAAPVNAVDGNGGSTTTTAPTPTN